jgi:hypothetical protein
MRDAEAGNVEIIDSSSDMSIAEALQKKSKA